MGYIKEKILKKLSTWKRSMLSQGDMEVLIKAIAYAIPIYTMQCFKVPKKVCDEVNSTMARFWWGQKQEEMEIHWASWMSLTTRNESGNGI